MKQPDGADAGGHTRAYFLVLLLAGSAGSTVGAGEAGGLPVVAAGADPEVVGGVVGLAVVVVSGVVPGTVGGSGFLNGSSQT